MASGIRKRFNPGDSGLRRRPPATGKRPCSRAFGMPGFWTMAIVAGFLFFGCASLRLHDPERLQKAKEVAALSEELRAGETSPYAAMEDNLEVVAEARRESGAQLWEIRRKAFEDEMAELTAEDVRGELLQALEDHERTLQSVSEMALQAAADVKTALERQKLITEILHGRDTLEAGSIEEVLKAVNERLVWVQDTVAAINKVAGRLNREIADRRSDRKGSRTEEVLAAFARISGQIEAGMPAAQKALQTQIEASERLLAAVEESPEVDAAMELLLQAGREISMLEDSRLQEMRRHLQAVQLIEESVKERHRIFIVYLMLPSLNRTAVETGARIWEKYREEFGLPEYTAEMQRQDREVQRRLWPPQATLAQYVANAFDADDPARGKAAVQLVESLGVLLFVEQPQDLASEIELATELHRHSIRLSQINAQQRLDVVNQIAQSLQIYYSGGVDPSEVAQMILLAAQVGALTYIGTQL